MFNQTEKTAMDKHASLFVWSMCEEEKSFFFIKLQTAVNVIELFSSEIYDCF
jgi:hypothetical protein